MLKTKNTKNLLILGLVALVVAAGAGGWYYHNHKNSGASTSDGINYGPPSDAQKQESTDAKKALSQNQSSSSSSTSKKTVTPLIVSYGQAGDNVKVSARVPGILEDSGTCTLTLTKGSTKVTQSKQATPNVSEMACGFISIPTSKLSSGSWSAAISYSSLKASGESSAVTIEVK